jgi:ATP-dependent protease Clp ATPase subunit
MREKTPKQIVDLLDKYIVGQNEAKKSVAIALYNRYPPGPAARRRAKGHYAKEHFDGRANRGREDGNRPPPG